MVIGRHRLTVQSLINIFVYKNVKRSGSWEQFLSSVNEDLRIVTKFLNRFSSRSFFQHLAFVASPILGGVKSLSPDSRAIDYNRLAPKIQNEIFILVSRQRDLVMAILFLAQYQVFILRRLIADNIFLAIIDKTKVLSHAKVKRPLFKFDVLCRLRCVPCHLTHPRIERQPEGGEEREAEVRVLQRSEPEGGGKVERMLPLIFQELPSSSFSIHVSLQKLSFPSLPATWSVSPANTSAHLFCLPDRTAPQGPPAASTLWAPYLDSYLADNLSCCPLKGVPGFKSLQKWLGQGQPSHSESTTYSAVQPDSLKLYHASSRMMSEASSIATSHNESVPLRKILDTQRMHPKKGGTYQIKCGKRLFGQRGGMVRAVWCDLLTWSHPLLSARPVSIGAAVAARTNKRGLLSKKN